jgi:SAM-dependent methyltransferase
MISAAQLPQEKSGLSEYLRRCDLREIDNADPDDPRQFRYLERIQAIMDLVRRFVPRGHVLEVGCAQGNMSLLLAEAGLDAVALDLREDFLRYSRAKRERGQITWVLANGLTLPFTNESFDAVIVGELIEHCSEPGDLLTEAARVLHPGGVLVASTPNGRCLGNLDHPFREYATARSGGPQEFGPGSEDHLFALAMEEMVSLFPPEVVIFKRKYLCSRFINSRTHPWLRLLGRRALSCAQETAAAIPVFRDRLCQHLLVVGHKR